MIENTENPTQEAAKHLGLRTVDGVEPMKNYGIYKDTTVIVKRNNKKTFVKINEVIKGDFILGYDLNNDKDIYNRVLEIQELDIPVNDQVRIWFKQGDFPDQAIVVAKGQQFDIYNHGLSNWDYRKAEDLMSGIQIKGTIENVSLNTVDTNCNMISGKFYMFILSGSYNFYIRQHDEEVDLEKQMRINEENAKDPTKRMKIEDDTTPTTYTKDYQDFVLVRALKG